MNIRVPVYFRNLLSCFPTSYGLVRITYLPKLLRCCLSYLRWCEVDFLLFSFSCQSKVILNLINLPIFLEGIMKCENLIVINIKKSISS